MSGHSKWSKVKHQKATTDVVKSAAFTKASRAITLAVKEGGGICDPEKNYHLRLAIEKAHDVNMPKDNIERAIARAAGEGSAALEHIMYEAYGPGGVAFLIDTATDNRQRTVSQIKNILERAGGTLASPGAVSFQFIRRGIITVPKTFSYDTVLSAAIDAGADDVIVTDDVYEVYARDDTVMKVRDSLTSERIETENVVRIMHPTVTVNGEDRLRQKTDELIAELDELDDVQNVYTNLS